VKLMPLLGKLLVSRDPDESSFISKDGLVLLHLPDDMASAGVNSWAAGDRMRASGFCHLHNATWGFVVNDRDLTGTRVFFEKWTEKTFEIEGRTFCVIDEAAIVAYEEEESEQ
jgi:hypothetical protein